jgi:hypothetical protein
LSAAGGAALCRRRCGTLATERKTMRRAVEELIDLTGSLDEIIAAEAMSRRQGISGLLRLQAAVFIFKLSERHWLVKWRSLIFSHLSL